MTFKSIFILSVSLFLLSFTANETAKWEFDKSHGKVGFSITHMMLSEVDGHFKKIKATVTSSSADFNDAVAEMTAEVSSIYTDNDGRDQHLLTADYFDATKYPTIDFKSKSFKKTSDNNYTVIGDLTMHGVTKSVTLNASARTGINPRSNKSITGFKITGKLNRLDWEIAKSTPAAMLGEIIEINANAEFVKQ